MMLSQIDELGIREEANNELLRGDVIGILDSQGVIQALLWLKMACDFTLGEQKGCNMASSESL